jgi:hypothetical protein
MTTTFQPLTAADIEPGTVLPNPYKPSTEWVVKSVDRGRNECVIVWPDATETVGTLDGPDTAMASALQLENDRRYWRSVDQLADTPLERGTAYQCELVDGTILTVTWCGYGRDHGVQCFRIVDTGAARDIGPSNVRWFARLADVPTWPRILSTTKTDLRSDR